MWEALTMKILSLILVITLYTSTPAFTQSLSDREQEVNQKNNNLSYFTMPIQDALNDIYNNYPIDNFYLVIKFDIFNVFRWQKESLKKNYFTKTTKIKNPTTQDAWLGIKVRFTIRYFNN